jgi:DNA-binding XRE family transcriptional regulator
MDGPAARALRKMAGMSQVEFGAAIGLSRETIGRMERGSEPVDRRSELAMRYIAEKGPVPLRSLQQIHEKVAAILDEAAVRGRVSYEAVMLLRTLPSDWAASDGGSVGASLLQSAQGLIGIINSLDGTEPYRTRAYEDLRQLKLAWAASRVEGSR